MFLNFFGKKKKSTSCEHGLIEGVDLSMCYCFACDVEYRAGVKSCAQCGIDLISGREMLARKQAVTAEFQKRSMLIDAEDPVVVLQRGAVRDMKAMQHLLKAERIPSILSGDEAGKGCCPELALMIKEVDIDAAQKVLAEDFIASTGVDMNDLTLAGAVFDIQAEEVVCPACRNTFSPSIGACPDCGLSFE